MSSFTAATVSVNDNNPHQQGDAQALSSELSLSIRGARVLLGTFGFMTALVAITYLLIDGFRLSAIDASALSDSDRSKLLDRYNSYSGSFASVVALPFGQFVATLLPVFFVCFASSMVFSTNKSFLMRWAPTLAMVAISWLVGQGLSALNVQYDSPVVEFIIAAEDLAGAINDSDVTNVVTNITDTTHLAGIPSSETILRSAIHPISSDTATACLNVDGYLLDSDGEASLRFGFPLNSWLPNLQSKSVAADASFAFSMNDSFQSGEVQASSFPSGDVNSTGVLFTYGFWTLWRQFSGQEIFIADSIDLIYTSVQASTASRLVTNIQQFVSNVTSEVEQQNSTTALWANISASEVAIEFSSFQLSPQILFEAVTFELPVKTDIMDIWTDSDVNGSYNFETPYQCNDHACVLLTPTFDNSVEDQVRLLRLCMTGADSDIENIHDFTNTQTGEYNKTCRFMSNSSVLLYSLARHIAVEEVTVYTTDNVSYARLQNPRIIYKATVGRLSWKVSDLAQVYDAKCTPGVNCDGLYYPLDTVHQHLVVGKAHIPAPHVIAYQWDFKKWQVLALANTKTSSDSQADIIYPPIYNYTKQSQPWSQLNGYNCTTSGSDFINDVIQRHIYSKDPVQPAYTAGLFWLFQNAGVKEIDMASSFQASTRLDFKGNRMWISPRVSVPLISACMTFVGCGVVVIVGVLVACRSFKSQHMTKVSSQLSTHDIASIRVNTSQFPPLLLQADVQLHSDNDKACIHEFMLSKIALDHESDASKQAVTIQSNCPTTKASKVHSV